MDRLMTLHARKKNCDKNVNELKSWYTTLKSVSQRIKEDGSSTEQYTTEDAMFEEFKKNCLEHVNQMITETVEKYHAAVDEQERVVEKCLKIEKQMVGIVSLVQLYESILEEKEKSETSRL
jgi:tryptophanyl-tRNA synthetase